MSDLSVVRWLKMVLALVAIPILIIGIGVYYLATLQQEVKIRIFEAEAAEILDAIRFVAGTENYLCSSFAEIFDTSADETALKSRVEQFAAAHDIKVRFVIQKADGSVGYSNFPHQEIQGDWAAAFAGLNKIRDRTYSGGERKIPPDVYANLRAVYGPHFFPRYYDRCFTGRNSFLCRNHASPLMPLLWVKVSEKAGLSIFLEPEVLLSDCGVKNLTGKPHGSFITGYIKDDRLVCADGSLAALLNDRIGQLKNSLSNVIRLPGYYLLTNFINGSLTAFCAVRAAGIDDLQLPWSVTAAAGFLMIGLLLFGWLSYLVMVRGQEFSLRLKRQLLVLFIASNALPGFVLLVIGFDYLQQYRNSLLNDAYNNSVNYLQNIDELYGNELTIQKERIERPLAQMSKRLKKGLLDRKTIMGFIKQQRPSPYGFYLVASSTGFVASERGILKDEKYHTGFNRNFKRDTVRMGTMKAMFKIGTFILASLNKQPIPSKTGMEAEIISESLTQRSPAELIRLFADRGTFSQWGIGSKLHPTYLGLLQVFDNSIYDYLLIFLWSADSLEFEFISRIFLNLNRNEFGLRVMAVNERFDHGLPPEVLSSDRLREFAIKLRDRSATRPETCLIDGVEYLLVGHKCVAMTYIRLLGLYPLSEIDRQVVDKKRLLMLLALVSLLVSVSLGLFVAGGILRPLAELQAGIGALNDRNFAWRLPDLGGDEFGHLASIFNETLVDLEELHVASQVQEKLMTRMTEPLAVGALSLFYQSAGNEAHDGDYFDLISCADGKTAAILGRVPEHGVASSLILAFVKSATMQLHHLAAEPAAFMASLHDLLLKSSSRKQQNRMQLLYVLVNEDGLLEMVNAGMPASLLLDLKARSLQLLESSSLPLGATGGGEFNVSAVRLGAGQVLMLSGSDIKPEEPAMEKILNHENADPQAVCQAFSAVAENTVADRAVLVISGG